MNQASAAVEQSTPKNTPRCASTRVKANGIELAYDSIGNPSAAPLLRIMGLGCQMIAWDDDFCAQLAARGYRVLRFDNRDIGLSTNCSHAVWTEA